MISLCYNKLYAGVNKNESVFNHSLLLIKIIEHEKE